MRITVRTYKKRKGMVEVDFTVRLPNGQKHRVRKVLETSKSAAKRWGEEQARRLLTHGCPAPTKEVPTLNEFAPRFIEGYAEANRQKPSGIAAKRTILKEHLGPHLGSKRLDSISNEDIQQLKQHLRTRSAKTVNNVLTVLNTLLRVAVEWQVLDRLPCTIRLLRVPPQSARFLEPAEFERLVAVARQDGSEALLIVLLGGEAGLRCGEMMGLQWTDVDLVGRKLQVARSIWKGEVTSTKGERIRYVDITQRLTDAFRQHRSRGPHVLAQISGQPLTQKMVQRRVRRVSARAGRPHSVHILRHTFCSRLALRGAPARLIQELAGHQNLLTTQRDMHVAPATTASAIRLLEPSGGTASGEIVETVSAST
jgi:integrase